MAKNMCVFVFTFAVLFFGGIHAETLREKLFGTKNGPCERDEFRCLNDVCVSKAQYCNGRNDCGDNSDETYCRTGSAACPTKSPFFRCRHDYSYYKCVPQLWTCDGVVDCGYQSEDETGCSGNLENDEPGRLNYRQVLRAKRSVLNWTLSQREGDLPFRKWGSEVSRIAVALYMANDSAIRTNNIRDEIAYELSITLLSKMALRKMEDVSTHQLASYVNAFIVSCMNPRKFYFLDLVSELRSRVNKSNYTNPFVMLALCNAGERITEVDVERLTETFWKNHREFWTDSQALAVMALSCASKQPNAAFDIDDISEFTMELKKRQYRNGTVDNLKTTALVMQALLASESEADEVNAYYVLPVLSQRSLVNISNSHCKTTVKDERDAFEDLQNQLGPKWSIQYSLWMGNDRTIERNLAFNLPANTSFYRIMEYAADIDTRFRFQYSMKNGKPYIYSISGVQDDPENGMFWFQHKMSRDGEKELIPITKSPADVLPVDNDHMVFWYKSGSWNK